VIGSVAAPTARGRLDVDNPWPALAAFEESDAAFFYGREAAIVSLLQIVEREDRVLLYGSSGLGKTSLLRAGLFPMLPPSIFPVYIRLHYDRDGASLTQQVLDAVKAAAAERRIEAPPDAPSGTLWEYFRRRNHPFWGSGNQLVVPLLVFDQFEQMFTRHPTTSFTQEEIDAFVQDLTDLISGSAPAWLGAEEAPDASRRYIFASAGCKTIFSFREDFLADVKRLQTLIPSVDRNALRLEPMRWTDAAVAVRRAGGRLLTPLPPGAAEHGDQDVAAPIGHTRPSSRRF
jgi:conflict system STAND superfamily ATPase